MERHTAGAGSPGEALATAEGLVRAPLAHRGKVRELYDLGRYWLIVVTDRISAFDFVLKPAVPGKGVVLNLLSRFWFERTADLVPNHMVHADVELLPPGIVDERDKPLLRDRMMVVKKAERIAVECVVRGYLTGGGWRQYEATGAVCGIPLPQGLRRNERLPEPLFTPAIKNDVGHDEDAPYERICALVGADTAAALRETSLKLYGFARDFCERRGILLADTKFEFGRIDGRLTLIDEALTPDSSRFWAVERYALDADIDSMDKEPVRTYLARSGWDRTSEPDPLPDRVVEETARRYRDIYRRLTGEELPG